MVKLRSTDMVSCLTTLVTPSRARGNSFLRFWLRAPTDPPAPRLRRAEGHARAAHWLLAVVDADVADSG
jgi:hypothetical protein